jgi:hypothetical protein
VTDSDRHDHLVRAWRLVPIVRRQISQAVHVGRMARAHQLQARELRLLKIERACLAEPWPA